MTLLILHFDEELTGYPYWTSGKFNDSAKEWQWSSTRRTIDSDRLYSPVTLRNEEDAKDKCVVFNYLYSFDRSRGFVARFCVTYGYRFIGYMAIRTLPTRPHTNSALLCQFGPGSELGPNS